MTEQTDAAEALPGMWRNHDDPRDEWPDGGDWNPEYVAGVLADAADEFWTALHAVYDSGGDTDALGSEYDAMARRIFTGPELVGALAAAEARGAERALREAADDWPEDGMTRAEAQQFLAARAAAAGGAR